MYDIHWSNAKYTNPSRAAIPLIRPHQCDSGGCRIRGVLLYDIYRRTQCCRCSRYIRAEFKQFTNECGIDHMMSIPYYLQSNGLVKNYVKVVKRIIGKAADRGEDPYLAMLAYRSSPPDCGTSPSELLFGRRIRSRLPYRCETCNGKVSTSNRGNSLVALQQSGIVRVKDT